MLYNEGTEAVTYSMYCEYTCGDVPAVKAKREEVQMKAHTQSQDDGNEQCAGSKSSMLAGQRKPKHDTHRHKIESYGAGQTRQNCPWPLLSRPQVHQTGSPAGTPKCRLPHAQGPQGRRPQVPSSSPCPHLLRLLSLQWREQG
jgi:hypothetical protein